MPLSFCAHWADYSAGAEDAAVDGNMEFQSMDLSYMGVQSIWMDDVGRYRSAM